jgi:integration host factor subunit alpha
MGGSMTKAEIVEQIYEQVGFSKKESAELVEKVFEAIKETLSRGEKVKISGFGNFVVRDKNSRRVAIRRPARRSCWRRARC